ncbi:ATP-binding cassette domain-containing protein [Cellulomonas sp. P5_E12]
MSEAPVRTPTTEAVAVVDDLRLSLVRNGERREILHGVSLSIAPGEIVGLVGESGSGKSMLALALLGLLPHSSNPETSGCATVTGVDMQRSPDKELRRVRRESLGAIFQDPMTSLNPTMRIGRQIRESTGDDAESVRLLEAVGVRDATLRLRVHPHQLSGGLRQRVMAAIAVAGRPRLVIADEPTTALDVTVQAQLLQLLRELRDDLGCSVLLITHDLGVADQIADRLAVLHHGELVELGPARTVVTHPSHAYTRSLLESRLSLSSPRDERFADGDAATAVGGGMSAVAAGYGDGTTVADGDTRANAVVAKPAVRVRGLERTFKVKHGEVRALTGVDLDVAPGEGLAIVGESGSGKSTLLRIVAGLESATAGTVEIAPGGAQMVFQDAGSSLTPWMSVGHTLAERLRPLKLSKSEQKDRIEEALDAVGLPIDVTKARPSELSGGQRQRVALARATVVPPAVLLCDEPTSALDASLARSVLALIRDLRARLGMTVLFVTHDLAVARLMGDRIAVMQSGAVVELGTADQVTASPQHGYTKTLLAAVPEIREVQV